MSDSASTSVTALIALGGNLGDVQKTFVQAIQMLRDRVSGDELRLSRLYQTQPVGVADPDSQPPVPFLNAALSLRVSCSPQSLLAEMQSIETALGRSRVSSAPSRSKTESGVEGGRWESRPIDLDLIGFGETILNDPDLTLPHPACWYRRFVLDPLRDVAADWRHPVLGETVQQLHRRLLRRPLRVAVHDASNTHRAAAEALVETVRQRFGSDAVHVEMVEGDASEQRTHDLTFHWPDPSREQTRLRAVSLVGSDDPAKRALPILEAALDQPVLVRLSTRT
jgi:2-amino-4-hydroxy-6-hydroxymethyldihydropteridine diphosphokinase